MKLIHIIPIAIIIIILGVGLILGKIDLSEFLSSVAVSYIAYKDFIISITDKIIYKIFHNNGRKP